MSIVEYHYKTVREKDIQSDYFNTNKALMTEALATMSIEGQNVHPS